MVQTVDSESPGNNGALSSVTPSTAVSSLSWTSLVWRSGQWPFSRAEWPEGPTEGQMQKQLKKLRGLGAAAVGNRIEVSPRD